MGSNLFHKAINKYSTSDKYQIESSDHLYANALVDVIHAINLDSLNIELKLKPNRLYDRANID